VENQDDAIAMGCLFGNQFGLVLRLLNPEDIDEIEKRVLAIRKNGIINYFGMQRFGSCGTKTHLVGKMILKKEWETLVQSLILEDTGNFGVNQMKR
jgi:tRNA pseudouridine13 synthase